MRLPFAAALGVVACLTTAASSAQSCLQTLFAANGGGTAGWGNFMDLTVLDPGGLRITSIEVNDRNIGMGGGPVEIEIWTTPVTYVNKELQPLAWTHVSDGSGSAQPQDTPTPLDVTDFVLQPGSHGVFVWVETGGGPAYTNGNGMNQHYADGSLQIDLGRSMAGKFTGAVFQPRVWNGTFCYTGGGGLAPYCTAKTNSLGCVPVISGSGTASASATSGFTVACAQVRNGKSGLLFYRAGGAQAGAAFQCGTLCVGPSGIRRTPAQSAGGTPPPANDCSGTYAIDMNAFAAGLAGGNPDPALGLSGTVVHCQWWGRDQGFAAPCNTTLSDGGEYTIGS